MSKASFFVDSFSGGLADLPARSRRDAVDVLRCLHKYPTFSVFDASEHQSLARTLDALKLSGLIEYEEPGPAYPWVTARLTDSGKKEIGA